MKFLFTSSSTGKICSAKALSSVCAALILFKYAVADMTLFGITFGPFDPVAASMLLGVFFLGYTKRESDKSNLIERVK